MRWSDGKRQPTGRVALLIGPTCVGKSTLLGHPFLRNVAGSRNTDDPVVVYGRELDRRSARSVGRALAGCDFLHFNLLHGARGRRGAAARAVRRRLRRVLDSGAIAGAVVLVSPMSELLSRAGRRVDTPEGHLGNSVYDRKRWIDTLAACDLVALYDVLFERLDRYGIPYEVVVSSVDVPSGFQMTERADLPDHLRGARPGALPARHRPVHSAVRSVTGG